MSHIRKQIRDAVVNLLRQMPVYGPKVYVNRDVPFEDMDLPALDVTTSSSVESSSIITNSYPVLYERTLPVVITAYARNTVRVQNTLDEMCETVETALGGPAGFGLGGLVKRMYLDSTEIDTDGQADIQVGMAKMTFMAVYQMRCNQPSQAR